MKLKTQKKLIAIIAKVHKKYDLDFLVTKNLQIIGSVAIVKFVTRRYMYLKLKAGLHF